ncbi:serine/arginine repetitive matrix protein 2, partial [Acidimicrobiaceae bacterium USS-CC1]|nr:serine/arginine repetitive matrix protein 2 [Acidiferrimicrobium australe]
MRPSLTEQRHAHAAAKIAEAQRTLATEVAKLVTGEDWRRFLDFQAKLHAYSPNNVMLAVAQHAQAFADGLVGSEHPTHLAGFHTWRALGRTVDRGQHGYAILAPCRYDRRVALDPNGQARPLAKDEAPGADEQVEKRRVLAGFRVEYVFDVSQTSGVPLPEPPRPTLLAGEAPAGLGAAVLEMIEELGFRVDTVPDASALQGANGQTNWGSRTVLIRADMDDAAMVKTLIHEAAHCVLHEGPPGQCLPRPVKEVEAESVAYVVASVHGMPTDGYSFPYVAGWFPLPAMSPSTTCTAEGGGSA